MTPTPGLEAPARQTEEIKMCGKTNLPHDVAAANGLGWKDRPEEYRAMDLHYFAGLLRDGHVDRLKEELLGGLDLMTDYMPGAVLSLGITVHHLHTDLLAWADGELAKIKKASR
jgi:hypothetical protein